MAEAGGGRSWGRWLAMAALVALAVVAGWLLAPDEQPESREAPSGRETLEAPESGVASLASGQTLRVDAAKVMAKGLALDLQLVEPSTAMQLEGRVVAAGRVLPMKAAVSSDRLSARVEIPVGWLSPDRYVLEIKTTERSPLAVRRYAIEVR